MINLTEERSQHIIRDLIHKNPLYMVSFLSTCKIELCDDVGIAKIIIDKNPTIQIDKNFVSKNCTTEEHVQSLIIHEFLHLVFSTSEEKATDEADMMIKNIAHDAIINAFIHRTLGSEYSSLMSDYYKDSEFPLNILRPPNKNDKDFEFYDFWTGIYEGKLTVEDVKLFFKSLMRFFPIPGASLLFGLLGTHSLKNSSDKVNGELLKILAEARIKIKDFESIAKDIGEGLVSGELEIEMTKKEFLNGKGKSILS